MPLVKLGLPLSNPSTHTGIADKNVFVQWPGFKFVHLWGLVNALPRVSH